MQEITLREVARDIGISPSHLSNILSGKRKVTVEIHDKVTTWAGNSAPCMAFFSTRGLRRFIFKVLENRGYQLKNVWVISK